MSDETESESIREEANRRGVSLYRIRADRGDTSVGPGRPKQYDDRVYTQIRVPRDLHDRLKAEAEARDVSMNYLVIKAVEDFLERLVPVGEWKMTR